MGTLYQLRNLVQRRNVRKQPKKDFNDHHDYFNVVVTSHILAAAMEGFGMENLEDEPRDGLVPPDSDSMTKAERKEILQYLVRLIIDSYVDINHCLSEEESDQNKGKRDINGKVSNSVNEDDELSSSEDDENSDSEDVQTSKDGVEVSKSEENDGDIKSRGSRGKDDNDYVKAYVANKTLLFQIHNVTYNNLSMHFDLHKSCVMHVITVINEITLT